MFVSWQATGKMWFIFLFQFFFCIFFRFCKCRFIAILQRYTLTRCWVIDTMLQLWTFLNDVFRLFRNTKLFSSIMLRKVNIKEKTTSDNLSSLQSKMALRNYCLVFSRGRNFNKRTRREEIITKESI